MKIYINNAYIECTVEEFIKIKDYLFNSKENNFNCPYTENYTGIYPYTGTPWIVPYYQIDNSINKLWMKKK